MLTDLFKPSWKSRSADKRLQAIVDMDSADVEKQPILTQLASNDVDNAIRLAAIQKMTSIADLHIMSLNHSDHSARQGAETRVNELMRGNHESNNDQYAELLNQFPELKLRIAAHADLASFRTDAIQTLSNDQLLVVLGETTYTDSRQLIAENLSKIEHLESARKIVRGKDKRAERIVKAKIDQYRAQQRLNADNIVRVEKLIEEIEYLVSHDWIPEFKAKLQVHQNNWDNLDFKVEVESSQRYQVSRQIVDKQSEEQNQIEQTHLAQQKLVDDVELFLLELAAKDLTRWVELLPDTLHIQVQYKASWKLLADKTLANLIIHDQFENMLGALQSATHLAQQGTELLHKTTEVDTDETELDKQSRIKKDRAENIQQLSTVLKNHKWPIAYGELLVATELKAILAKWRSEQTAGVVERQQKLDALHKKISSIFRFSRNGNLGRAQQLCDRVEKGLTLFTGKDRVALDERFAEAREALGDMGDWKNYATEPKYVELCEAMELLVNSKTHPDKLSNDMKQLQKQWKALGHSEISDQYWVRFKEAADAVYKPCVDFFEKRHETRQSHLEQRQPIVEQMRKLLEDTDWENDPDYKKAQSSLRSISELFANIKDVERNAGQKQWKQFSKYKEAVYAKLEVAYEANLRLKQQLIQQAQVLAEAEPKDDNLIKLKALQTRWKHIGITQRNQDQKAWKEFKKQGDITYENLQQQRQGQRDETDLKLSAYRNIISDIQKLAKSATQLAEADPIFSTLQANYEALPELPATLPEKLIDGLQRDYGKACDQYDQCHARIIKNMHAQQLDALRQKAKLCALLEAMGESASQQQLLEISQQWDAIELHNAAFSRCIDTRRKSALTILDRDAIGEQRRLLCIQLEILQGVESPPEDKVLRMQYQLEQMNESGLGQQAVNHHQQIESMTLDWLCMSGANPQQQQTLDERFYRVLQSSRKSSDTKTRG